MKKLYLFAFLALFFSTHIYAQQQDRVLLEGLLVVPEGIAAEGIHVFNKSNNRGSIVTAAGRFEIFAGESDTLIFSGIQFKELEVVVSAGMMSSGIIQVDIEEGVNELPEVVIREHNLSGVLSDDSKRIVTETYEVPVVPPPVGPPTGVESPENSAMNQMSGGANLLGLLQAGVGLLFPKRTKEPTVQRHTQTDQIKLRQQLRDLLGDDFFLETLDLKKEEIGTFLEFCVDRDFDSQLLEEKQRMYLYQFLFDQRETFRP